MVVTVTAGSADTLAGTDWLSWPVPVALTMRSALIAWSTLLVADLDSEAPNTDIAATRASPTISADAVWAVRRGLRIEFSRPSLPGSPNSRASGRPITLDSGRAIAGDSMATPTKMPTAPTPTSAMAGRASPVTTCTPAGRAAAMSRWTAGLLAPGTVTTSMKSSWPASWRTAWAVGSVNAARVAPARLPADPNSAMPLMVNVPGAPASRMRTRCPTAKSYLLAVPASITTSSEVTGGPPAIMCKLDSC